MRTPLELPCWKYPSFSLTGPWIISCKALLSTAVWSRWSPDVPFNLHLYMIPSIILFQKMSFIWPSQKHLKEFGLMQAVLHVRTVLKASDCTTSLLIGKLTDGVIIWPWKTPLYQITNSFKHLWVISPSQVINPFVVVAGTVWMSYIEEITKRQIKAP